MTAIADHRRSGVGQVLAQPDETRMLVKQAVRRSLHRPQRIGAQRPGRRNALKLCAERDLFGIVAAELVGIDLNRVDAIRQAEWRRCQIAQQAGLAKLGERAFEVFGISASGRVDRVVDDRADDAEDTRRTGSVLSGEGAPERATTWIATRLRISPLLMRAIWLVGSFGVNISCRMADTPRLSTRPPSRRCS